MYSEQQHKTYFIYKIEANWKEFYRAACNADAV